MVTVLTIASTLYLVTMHRPLKRIPETSFLKIKRLELEAQDSPPSTAHFSNSCSYTCSSLQGLTSYEELGKRTLLILHGLEEYEVNGTGVISYY
jgi:hypothetical protein